MKNNFTVPSGTFEKIVKDEAGINEYIGLEPPELRAMAALAGSLYEQGRVSEARTILEGLTALDPRLYLGYAGLGAIQLIEEQLEPALTNLSRAAGLNPDDPSVQANLGEVLLRQAKFIEASRCFERALALDPKQEDAGANRARAIIAGLKLVAGEPRS
ncbi:MAG: tetratricopeptide repeat protein [Candidatus Solibacter sp.]|nr:tetratricopeptide repeat protein [Candidatus Solibacter sp.]